MSKIYLKKTVSRSHVESRHKGHAFLFCGLIGLLRNLCHGFTSIKRWKFGKLFCSWHKKATECYTYSPAFGIVELSSEITWAWSEANAVSPLFLPRNAAICEADSIEQGSQPFSYHVPLQHSDRWECTPSAFQQVSMYPFSLLTGVHVPLRYPMTIHFIMIIHWYI